MSSTAEHGPPAARGDRAAALHRLRRSHEQILLGTLARHGTLSRAELATYTGLSRTTLFAIVADLLASQLVVENTTRAAGQRGRPAGLLSLNPGGGLYVGIDMGRHRVRVAIANVAHEVVATGRHALPAPSRWADRADVAIGLVERLADDAGISLAPLRTVGLGLPGPVSAEVTDTDRKGSDSARSRAQRGLVRTFHERFGVPVSVDNNTRLAALAETTWGAARGARDVLYVRLSDGVGGGLVLGGQLVRGTRGAAGEVGHVTVDPDGPPCYCGGRGCLETYVGGLALVRECRRRGTEVSDVDGLVQLVRDGDPAVCAVVAEAGRTLGVVLAGLATEVDPERIVVGGPVSALGEPLLAPVREAVAALTLPAFPDPPPVVGSELGDGGGALGAIAGQMAAVETGLAPN
ncbi:ROK family transcriptional regulator [Actinocatenispora rupis]|uniref:Transcriptional regulator n=1 Tax=Actinocatenispora rupis TaxID=519421 RepID=A0A8J3IVV7_9ACTN|nr:ROK family transcriptional regulator [Actinocatenispora rupis]GID09555.1 transcriptional regulator [Actinocatenispora rupis]